MNFPRLKKFAQYFILTAMRWHANGSGRLAVVVNLVWLALAWLLFPLEREPLKTYRARLRFYYPLIDFDAPKVLDIFRWLIQSVYLLVCRTPAGEPGFVARQLLRLYCLVRELLSRFGDWLNRYGSVLLAGPHREIDAINEKSSALPRSVRLGILWVMVTLAVGLALLCITQPFNIQGQVVFLSVMLLSALALRQIKARMTLMLLFVISLVVSGRYLWWRCTSTLNTDTGLGMFLSLALLAAELYAFVVMVLGYFQVCWVLDRKPYPMPKERSLWPHVDVYIPTYNEPLEVIKPTVFAALNLQWPEDKLHVYILDDGSRASFRAFAEQVGAGYIEREIHNHAKAGNINHAMTQTDGELIAIFDCDHVPSSDFLVKTVGWMIKDSNIALVQTPHHFYSPDPFEKNLHLDRSLPSENALFHDFIQKGNDTWNATMFCGSNAVIRRKALNQIGGIAVETVTEDAHTSLKLNRLGWSSAFIDVPLSAGLSTETLAAHIGQRIRWARGMIQIFRLDNPFLGKGLTLAQRLCFFNAMFHFFHGLPRLIFLVAPLPYMFGNIYVIYATAMAIFAYVLPHMIHSALTNQILQRGHRYPFISGVYETVLSWYILLPTTVALFMPHKGKFNVTAKGGTIGQKYLDWHISKPFLVLIALNAVGLMIGLYKAFFDPRPEYLTLAINIGWIGYNLMILGASMGVAVEEVQTHQFPRVRAGFAGEVSLQAGEFAPAQVEEFSQVDVRIRCEALKAARVGEAALLRLSLPGSSRVFHARVQSNDGCGTLELQLELADLAEEREFNRYSFSREGIWVLPPRKIDDRLWTGFVNLGRLAAYGYRSMVQFLPGKLQYVRKALQWVGSFVPKTPA